MWMIPFISKNLKERHTTGNLFAISYFLVPS